MFKTRQQLASAGARALTDRLFVGLLSLYAMITSMNQWLSNMHVEQVCMEDLVDQSSGTDVYQTIHTILKMKD